MMVAALTFSASQWRTPALAGLALLALATIWSYSRRGDSLRRWPGLVLKLLGLTLLALCLLEPQWTGQRVRPGANLFAILADNSAGLNLTDAGANKSRAEQMKDLLNAGQRPWLATLAETFEVRRYSVDSRLQSLADFGALAFAGHSSELGHGLKSLGERFQGRPLAGVLLFSDGNATDPKLLTENVSGLPPVYPVIIGGKGPDRDLAIQKATTTQTAFEDAPVTVDAEIAGFGCSGEMVKVQITDAAGKLVAEQEVRLPESNRPASAHFQLKPDHPGLCFYELAAQLRNGGSSREATDANNRRVLVIDRGQGPFRILYVGGRPNWEYKALRRSLETDAQVQLVGLIRVAKREPKFDFRGRAGESSNPLFRGFGDQSREAAGSYDQPVLVRLNTRDEFELRSGYPAKPEDLFSFHAVIVDDLEASFFMPDQSTLTQRFVTERGGGFLMLGGMESFADGGYAHTSIGEMLPVYLDRSEGGPDAPRELRYDLDREGWLQPWARLRENESAEKDRLSGMPPFRVVNRVRDVKPGASVIATVSDQKGEPAPALVVQRFGHGRTGALTVGDFWRWGMRNAATRQDLERAWRQLLRWLVSDVPGRVSLSAEPAADSSQGAIQLVARVRDAKWQPVDDAKVVIEVESVLADAAPTKLRITAEPSLEEAGLYKAIYVPRTTGGYKAAAVALNGAGAEEGRAETGWSTDLAADEFRSLVPNASLLESLAYKTGGRVIPAEELEAWARSLPSSKAPVMETWSQPLWHTPWAFLLAVACLVGEWGWRRTHGWP